MRVERWNEIHTSGKGSVYSIFNPGEEQLKDIVVKDVVEDREGRKVLPGLDLLPTTFDLIDLEHEYTPPEDEPVFVRFRKQLKELESEYDYILFDCPPNVLRASQCGLFCANEVIVPANPDALSLIGFTLLTGKLIQFNERTASFRSVGMGHPAMINGVIFNSVKSSTDIEVPKMRMQFRINQFRNQKKISPKTRIFNSMIRDAIVVRRAVTLGLPVHCIGNAMGTEGVVDDYEAVTGELEALAGESAPNSASTNPMQQAATV
jgi:chromosome partitioning protein